MTTKLGLAMRLKAAGIHALISLLVALATAGLVFGLWFPGPYRLIAGGQSLFLLVVSVDLVLGPLLTFVAFNPAKTRSHLIRDLAVIAALQLAGLAYGVYSVYLARPVAVVFEVDRFRVISDADVLHSELPQASPEFKSLPLTGPLLAFARVPTHGEEKLKAFELSMQGYDVGSRPLYWEPYGDKQREEAAGKTRPVKALYDKYPEHKAQLDAVAQKSGLPVEQLGFLPIISRNADWSVLLDKKTGNLVGFLPFGGFF